MSMRVLITGANGQVGRELMRRVPAGFKAMGMSSAELDITNAQQLNQVVANLQPQMIINAAAYTAVDKAENEVEQAWAVNCEGVRHLAAVAEQLDIPLLHISTDYVFAGDADKPYQETDATEPTGVYGASKLAGEKTLADGCRQYIVLRTSWVFGAHGSNFVKTMLRLGRERSELSVVADQYGCPTSAASIADTLWALAQRYSTQGTLQWGVYHFSGTPLCTWHAFAQEIFSQAKAQGLLATVPVVHAITTADYPTAAKRPAWSVMDGSKLYTTYGIAQPDWQKDLKTVVAELV